MGANVKIEWTGNLFCHSKELSKFKRGNVEVANVERNEYRVHLFPKCVCLCVRLLSGGRFFFFFFIQSIFSNSHPVFCLVNSGALSFPGLFLHLLPLRFTEVKVAFALCSCSVEIHIWQDYTLNPVYYVYVY